MQTQTSSLILSKRVWQTVKPFWPVLLMGLVANMFYSSIDAGFTYAIKPFLNKSFIDKDLSFVQWIPLLVLIGISMRGIINSTAGYCMTWVARSVVKVFRQKVFAQFLVLPAKYYDRVTSGQLLSRLLYDVEQISQVSADALTTFVQSFCLVVGLLTVMFMINWRLTALFLITIPIIGVIVQVTNKRIRRVSHQVQNAMGDVTSIAEENIENYRVVKIFGGQSYEQNKFDQAIENSRSKDMKVAITKALNVSGVQIVIAIGTSAIALMAIKLSTVIVVTAGGFVSITAAMLQLIKPMKNLTTVNSVIQRGLAGAKSVFDFLDETLEHDQGRVDCKRVTGKISYQNVNFAYTPEKTVLKNINLDIEPNTTVAFVGRSGSGKSTFVSLLPRFYDITDGSILIDDTPINELTLESLRRQIAIVTQNITLFNDTIANNIAYGMSDKVTMEDILNAAKAANAFEFIENLPKGFNTIVGENGVLLSGGQRQRIAIARAIIKDAPIIILDEATSALDTESERLIQSALTRVMRDRTTLVIAHRLSTIEHADKIVVLDEGHIVETGDHKTLLSKAGDYSRLYQLQFNQQDNRDVA